MNILPALISPVYAADNDLSHSQPLEDKLEYTTAGFLNRYEKLQVVIKAEADDGSIGHTKSELEKIKSKLESQDDSLVNKFDINLGHKYLNLIEFKINQKSVDIIDQNIINILSNLINVHIEIHNHAGQNQKQTKQNVKYQQCALMNYYLYYCVSIPSSKKHMLDLADCLWQFSKTQNRNHLIAYYWYQKGYRSQRTQLPYAQLAELYKQNINNTLTFDEAINKLNWQNPAAQFQTPAQQNMNTQEMNHLATTIQNDYLHMEKTIQNDYFNNRTSYEQLFRKYQDIYNIPVPPTNIHKLQSFHNICADLLNDLENNNQDLENLIEENLNPHTNIEDPSRNINTSSNNANDPLVTLGNINTSSSNANENSDNKNNQLGGYTLQGYPTHNPDRLTDHTNITIPDINAESINPFQSKDKPENSSCPNTQIALLVILGLILLCSIIVFIINVVRKQKNLHAQD